MKQVHNSFNETAYETQTASGLRVIIIHKPGFKKSMAALGTPFGSLALKQRVDGVEIQHKTGVAHFLEHKLFEHEGMDVFEAFSNCGAQANAFTSFDYTVYYFSTHGAVLEPLGILIDFVSQFSIEKPAVEKEKGIILEELSMYKNMPEMNLLMKTYENTFHHFPKRIDIGGTSEDVSAMEVEDLINAYRLNYHDSMMALVVVSGEDPMRLMEVIDAHCAAHPLVKQEVETVLEDEPLTVYKEVETITDRVQTPKMSVSYKFAYTGNNKFIDEYLLRLVLQANFSEMNDDYQSWLDQGVITEQFSYGVELRPGFGVLHFFNEGEDPDGFLAAIDKTVQNLSISESDFDQLRKRHLGQMILSLERIDQACIQILTTALQGENYFEILEGYKTVTKAQMDQCLKDLRAFSRSFLVMEKGLT